jgi:hypothetical protein
MMVSAEFRAVRVEKHENGNVRHELKVQPGAMIHDAQVLLVTDGAELLWEPGTVLKVTFTPA